MRAFPLTSRVRLALTVVVDVTRDGLAVTTDVARATERRARAESPNYRYARLPVARADAMRNQMIRLLSISFE